MLCHMFRLWSKKNVMPHVSSHASPRAKQGYCVTCFVCCSILQCCCNCLGTALFLVGLTLAITAVLHSRPWNSRMLRRVRAVLHSLHLATNSCPRPGQVRPRFPWFPKVAPVPEGSPGSWEFPLFPKIARRFPRFPQPLPKSQCRKGFPQHPLRSLQLFTVLLLFTA